jgi:3-isopropylmalate/(R)-2-methylmalate dehydratase small subunit
MTTLTGRVWSFGDDINTDLILPVHAILRERHEQARYVFEANRPGWAEQVAPGDILVAGESFGLGSGRPAARVLSDLGIAAVIAESINGLFLRNAVTSGLLCLKMDSARECFKEGDEAEIDSDAWSVTNVSSGVKYTADALPRLLREMMTTGGIMPFLTAGGYVRDSKEENETLKPQSHDQERDPARVSLR